MTAADVFRFAIIIGLGILAVVTFLVAGTITGLMLVDDRGCGWCSSFPVGLWVLSFLGLIFLVSMISEAANDAPEPFRKWVKDNRSALILGLIALVAFIIVFWD